jgi:uncharacterized protein YjbI with pentapeptide repeats
MGILISIIGGYIWGWEWTGVVTTAAHPLNYRPLWDWLELLLVPTFLAIGVGLFNWALRNREEQREDFEREREKERSQDLVLQTYLDRMTSLLLDKGLRGSQIDSDVRRVARARTMTILTQLESFRKGYVLRFLYESGLIFKPPPQDNPVIDLGGARFDKAGLPNMNLKGAQLRGANFLDAFLYGADLRDCDLREAEFAHAELLGADLRGADLSGAHMLGAKLGVNKFEGAKLDGTYLGGASIRSSDLQGVDLRTAFLAGADLSHSNLKGAKVVDGQLDDVWLLECATLPNGEKLPPGEP